MRFSPHIGILLLIGILICFPGCHKESNPAVPPAPEGDVVDLAERNPMMRIGLLSFTPQKHIYISITRGSLKCYSGESLESFAGGLSGDVLQFTGQEGIIEFTDAGSDTPLELEMELIRIEPAEGVENGFIEIGTSRSNLRPYRGTFRLILEGKNLLAVNEVPLEDYLLGVVPAEVDPRWPEEVLKAQAIASRTFALFQKARYQERGFNLADDERSQRYGGVAVETKNSTNAVVETVNEILAYDDTLACVVFHAESVERTASNLDIWPHSGDVPYLVEVSEVAGVVDFSEGGRYTEWSNWASFNQLLTALNRDGETFLGDYLTAITVLGISENGRVQSLDLLGEKNPVVDTMTLAFVLNRNLKPDFLPSNHFKIRLEGRGYRFTGSGKGHGVGMNQWGAYRRAATEQTHRFILEQYYPGCEITTIPLDGLEAVHNTRIDTIR